MSPSTGTDLAARARRFLTAVRAVAGVADLRDLPVTTEQPAVEAPTVALADPHHLAPAEIEALAAAFHGRLGMAAFECRDYAPRSPHALVALGEQLREHLPCRWPVANFEDVGDGTTKIRDIGPVDGRPRALSNQALAAHQDGWWTLPGVLAVTGLCADTSPPVAAASYVQNLVRLALDLWRLDEPAFLSLFHPEAVLVVRREDGARLTAAALTVGDGRPRAFFRCPNDQFDVLPGRPDADTGRAVRFLAEHTRARAPGSAWIELDRPGRGFLLDNGQCAHGRTAFEDGHGSGRQRVIASKWWAAEDRYRDVHWGEPDAPPRS